MTESIFSSKLFKFIYKPFILILVYHIISVFSLVNDLFDCIQKKPTEADSFAGLKYKIQITRYEEEETCHGRDNGIEG